MMAVRMRAPSDLSAAIDWANCGPAAIAAVLGLDLADVRESVSGRGKFPGYMGVRDIQRACKTLGRPVGATSAEPGDLSFWPHGIYLVMVNIDGPWRRDPRAQAQHRHIVAVAWDSASSIWRVYDVNSNYWSPVRVWVSLVMEPLARDHDEDSTGKWSFSWRGACDPGGGEAP